MIISDMWRWSQTLGRHEEPVGMLLPFVITIATISFTTTSIVITSSLVKGISGIWSLEIIWTSSIESGLVLPIHRAFNFRKFLEYASILIVYLFVCSYSALPLYLFVLILILPFPSIFVCSYSYSAFPLGGFSSIRFILFISWLTPKRWLHFKQICETSLCLLYFKTMENPRKP